MISPELLRRFPFFAPFNDAQLKEIAMIAEATSAEAGVVLFEECQPATHLYLLLEGGVELFYQSKDEYYPKTHKEFMVGDINPGDVFAISAMLEPYILNAGARLIQPSRYITIEAVALREMFATDYQLAYHMMVQISKMLMERLVYTRVQLAAAWT